MRLLGLDDELPPNFADLPDGLKAIAEEALYRRAYIRKWAFPVGDSRLRSAPSEKDHGGDLEKVEVVKLD